MPQFPQKPNQFIAQNRSNLLDWSQSSPKTYFLLLLQFRISAHKVQKDKSTRKKNCIPQTFSRFAFGFASIFHSPSCHSTLAKVKTTTVLACANPSFKAITTSMSFCHSVFRVSCHVWVKLCAEQLCGFCTSCSPIVCGKLPLQPVFFQFDMPPLYFYISIP